MENNMILTFWILGLGITELGRQDCGTIPRTCHVKEGFRTGTAGALGNVLCGYLLV